MKTYSLLYAGQLRFIECIPESLALFSEANAVHASFHTNITDSPKLNAGVSHSIYDLPLEWAIETVKNYTNYKSFRIVEDFNIFNESLCHGWPLWQLYTALKSFDDCIRDNSDFLILISSDVFLSPNSNISELINNLKITKSPYAVVQKLNKNEINNTIVILNKAAVSKLQQLGIDALLHYQKRYTSNIGFKTEFAWYTIFRLLNIKLVKLTNIYSIRYRPTMGDINNVKKLTYNELSSLFIEYSNKKREMIYGNNIH